MIRTRTRRLAAASTVALGLVGLTAVGASADTQIVNALIGSSVSITTSPLATVDMTLSASGVSTASGGTLGVTSNLPYVVTVSSSKAKLTQFVNNAYNDSVTVAAPLSVIPVLSSGVGVPVPSLAVGTIAAPIATGALGSASFALTLSQATVITDAPTTYRNVLTYTASSAL